MENINETQISSEDLKVLNECLYRTHAKHFNDFLSRKIDGNFTYIQSLKQLVKTIKFTPAKDNHPVDLSEAELMQTVIDFYHGVHPDLGEKVERIFSGNQITYNIHLATNKSDKRFGLNNVIERHDQNQLDFNVTLTPDVDGMLNLTHELSHALSNRTLTSLQLLKKRKFSDEDYEEFESFHTINMQPHVDCVTEIESHIMELLFMQSLKKINLISEEIMQDLLNVRNNSLRNNLTNIIAEYQALEMMGYPVTEENYNKFATWSKENNTYLLKRIQTKIDAEKIDNCNNDFAKYKFRYVVAELVSTVWFNKFTHSNQNEKRKMLKTFLSFLNNNAHTDLSHAVNGLLDMSVEDMGKEFVKIKQKANINYEF